MRYSVAGASPPVYRFLQLPEYPPLRPLAIFLGIAMGSAVALLAGLSMTAAVFILLPEFSERLHAEQSPLLAAVLWATSLTLVSSLAFVGEVRERAWRRWPQGLLVLFLAAMGWHYWPT
jgi:hypothetical protein